MHALASDLAGAWIDVPTDLLRAELSRRQDGPQKPACGSGHVKGAYNTSLHVGALVLILVLSTAACSFPIIVRRFPKIPVPHHILFLSRHFGTGVLIATAFVHLLPTAFVSLTDPCLPYFWNQGYPAMAGLIAMTSVLVVVGVEMFFATSGAGHMHSEYETVPQEQSHTRTGNGHIRLSAPPSRPLKQTKLAANGRHCSMALALAEGSSEHLVPGMSPSVWDDAGHAPDTTTSDTNNSEAEADSSDLDPDEPSPRAAASGLLQPNRRHQHPPPSRAFAPSPSPATPLSPHASHQKLLLQCLLLEAGILFHSVFIGLALSTFEGLALGSRIAAIRAFPRASPKPWLMALAYGTTTPVGQAVGLAVHNLYDPAGRAGLLMVGVMNAVSSGLLLFAGLVELLAEDFLSEASYESLRGRRRVEAWGRWWGGLLMALVGAWA
ncbi:MAG: Zinc iron permease [Lasallia pustulata]|uniref:Zinc iron permease n=1 Tax=Lasallia pustulata TaxID=136370 RepID=A0A5M8Q0G5_9LECA|nr:MAG: Zinc iron permease [Lasallia pustulata]